MSKKKKKSQWGGPRENSGRPPGEPTIIIRVPVSKLEEIKKLIGKD